MIRRLAALVSVVVAALAVSGGSSPAAPGGRARASAAVTRYSIVHGCYRLRTGSGQLVAPQDGPFRMQAAALGEYLLYGVHDDFIGQDLTPVASPGQSTIWRVDGNARTGFTLTNGGGGSTIPVSFIPAAGCAVYPEAEVGAVGSPFTGASPEAGVLGTAEGHAHVTAFELFGGDWHCGTPFSPYGAPYALPASCAKYEQGSNGAWQSVIDYGSATRPSDMHGWPTFKEWPSPTALAEEGDYWTGIERAWMAGLRVMVSNNVDNEPLCRQMTTTSHACNDMVSVRLQAHDLYALQDYIDAQSGGPGKGFFRIVRDPFQARTVINQGKLAVIMGIEVSRIFGCGESNNVPQCNQSQVDAGLAEVHKLGVRTFFPVHEFNNAFGGSKMIAGETGIIINAGNREETGSFFTLKPCSAQDQDAEQTTLPATGAFAQLLNGPFASLLGGNATPIYGPGPQCNVQGLTPLGAYLINKMIKQHVVIQLDHMDSKTASQALAIAEAHHYAGVVSAHCCNSPQLFDRMYKVGGAIDAPKDQAAPFLTLWRQDAAKRSGRYLFGFGFGSDMNGLSQQTGPDASNPIHYPFKSFDGGTKFARERWGQRVFDLNTDGVANYGLYADWLQSVRQAGGHAFTRDMFNGAEAYLQMWERAYGVPETSCRSSWGYFSAAGTRVLRLGATWVSLLYSLGQPSSRPGRSFRYCVDGSAAAISAVFDSGGKAALFTSTAAGYGAGDVHPGASGRALRGRATEFAPGVWLGPGLRGGARFVYGVRTGVVRYVGVASRAVLASRAALSADLRAAGVA